MKPKPIEDQQIISALQAKAAHYRQVLSGLEAAIAAMQSALPNGAHDCTSAELAGPSKQKLTLPRLKELLASKSVRVADLPSIFDVTQEDAAAFIRSNLAQTPTPIELGKRGWLKLAQPPITSPADQAVMEPATH